MIRTHDGPVGKVYNVLPPSLKICASNPDIQVNQGTTILFLLFACYFPVQHSEAFLPSMSFFECPDTKHIKTADSYGKN